MKKNRKAVASSHRRSHRKTNVGKSRKPAPAPQTLFSEAVGLPPTGAI